VAVRPTVVGRFYQVATPRSVGERLTIVARQRIYEDFVKYCRPSPQDKILDVGVSDVINEAANMLERKYPHQDQITAVGIGEGDGFYAAFPQVAYHRIEANRPLPFPAQSFDIAVSNAVLEHVGSEQHQVSFVNEMVRVARRVFITVPNRYFPVEHHTAIPLLHFWTKSFEFACRYLDKSEWADERNLILMPRRRLSALAPAGLATNVGYTGIAAGVFSSNLFLFIDTAVAGPPGSGVPGEGPSAA
jgi:SAM-dependent methyltransferase